MKKHTFFSSKTEAELTSANYWETLQMLADSGIILYQIREKSEICVLISVKEGDYSQCDEIVRRTGGVLKKKRQIGIQRYTKAMLARPVLTIGLCLLALAILVLPARVFFVSVSGNQTVETHRIIESAERNGLYFGCLRASLRSEKIKNKLLEEIPSLEWAGINTAGCKAVITVNEKKQIWDLEEEKYIVSSIYAAMDGIVESIVVTQGTAQFAIGDAVKRGQCLISGYTDCGLCIQASRAVGEVQAKTIRAACALTPRTEEIRQSIIQQKKYYSVRIGKKLIKFWKGSGIWGAGCGRIQREYPLILPGGFALPVCLIQDTIIDYSACTHEISSGAVRNTLSEYTQEYLKKQMIAGRIEGAQEGIQQNDGLYYLKGEYSCTEMIGRERRE